MAQEYQRDRRGFSRPTYDRCHPVRARARIGATVRGQDFTRRPLTAPWGRFRGHDFMHRSLGRAHRLDWVVWPPSRRCTNGWRARAAVPRLRLPATSWPRVAYVSTGENMATEALYFRRPGSPSRPDRASLPRSSATAGVDRLQQPPGASRVDPAHHVDLGIADGHDNRIASGHVELPSRLPVIRGGIEEVGSECTRTRE